MKVFPYLAALAMASVATSATAAVFDLGFSGTVVGVQNNYCGFMQSDCQNSFLQPFSLFVDRQLFRAEIADGQSFNFETGTGRDFPFFSGTITNNGGFLTGTSLNYFRTNCPAGIPFSPCFDSRGSAATFNVTGGIPEPTTWAMMLMGFAAVGYSMRRRRPRLAVAG